jgi:hypothetical protein
MNFLATLLLLIGIEPVANDSLINRTALIEERAVIDTIGESGIVRAEFPQFVIKDERDGKLANEINTIVRDDVMRRMGERIVSVIDSFAVHYVYTVSYLDAHILSCHVMLYVDENPVSTFAINYDIRNDGPLLLSRLLQSVDNYDSLYSRWSAKQNGQTGYKNDLTDLTWFITPAGIGLLPRYQWPESPECEATLIGFKDNADLFTRRLSVVDRALRE